MITIKEKRIWNYQRFVLSDKKSIIYEKRMETGIFEFLSHFSKIWRIRARYKVDRIEERVDSFQHQH